MKINAYIERTNVNQSLNIKDNANVSDLLKELKINPITVIVTRNNEVITEKEKLKDNDKLEILSVISGG